MMAEYIVPTVRTLKAYSWEDSSEKIAEAFGLKPDEVVRFDMNTNPYFLAQGQVVSCAKDCANAIAEYPDASYSSLASKLSQYAECAKDELVICAGCDEVLDVAVKAFLGSGRKLVTSEPTYPMAEICASGLGNTVVRVMRKKEAGYAIDEEEFIAECADASLAYVCNPNSPTGNFEPVDKIVRIAKAIPCALFVDEAYFEFAGQSVAQFVRECPNLVIGRTFSKAFGLAGARVGYAIANRSLVSGMEKVRPPNSVSAISLALAQKALEERDSMQRNAMALAASKKNLSARLSSLGLSIFPSQTNFLLADFGSVENAANAYCKLLQKGLVVRDVSRKPGVEGCLRITVRKDDENERLAVELERILQEQDETNATIERV